MSTRCKFNASILATQQESTFICGFAFFAGRFLGADITDMQIYRTGNRLFMIMETTDEFDPNKKAAMDEANPKVQEWENLMNKYQQPLPWAKQNEKWVLMDKIFRL